MINEYSNQRGAEKDEVDNVIRTVRPYGIMELARTGRVAMARGSSAVRADPSQENYAEHSQLGRRPAGRLPYVSDEAQNGAGAP